MNWESFFRFALIGIFSLFSMMRIEYYRRAKKAGWRTVIEESLKYSILLSVFICYEIFTFFIYLFFPQWLSWAGFRLSIGLRLAGASLGVAALALFIWVHQSLGRNFSTKLRIKENHTMVTRGPYQMIRHPMYSAFYLLHLSVFFLTSNWFIGLTWLAGLTLIVLLRVRREEAMMVEHFGEDYVDYMSRTGRFLPPLRLRDVFRKVKKV